MKFKRQKSIMADNRQRYPFTIEVLKEWRKRETENFLHLFEDFKKDKQLILTEKQYNWMHNFLITAEVITPKGNDQESFGMRICEVNK